MKSKKSLTKTALENSACIDAILDRGEAAIRELDKIVREKFRDDPVKLAEWEEAIRLDTSPRRSAKAPPPIF
ncbi:MAG TPA: hypothetical protein VEX60_02205, partial [Pyrinomonadaceae bacterium]|nr:hypothetical protein [Pyrinomonadaceae bacterium]